MDAVLISVQPEHAENVLDGFKTYEIRKILPSCSFPYILYIYETKKIYRTRQGIKFPGAGAVVGYAIIGAHIRTNIFSPEVEKLHFRGFSATENYNPHISPESVLSYQNHILENACITRDELIKYANLESVSALVVHERKRYKKPLPLSRFGLSRPPQSWQYLRDIKDVIDVE